MNSVYLNADVSDDQRREGLYNGQLYVYSARNSTAALCQHARDMCEEAFAPHDPCDAQHQLPVERYVEILAELKPSFIHHPKSKTLIQAVLKDLGCDMAETYFDVPRLRTVTSDGYLTAGLGYAFKPHRDSWYSTPMCQLNWWLPIYEIESENSMAFHPHYWDTPIKNSSNEFDYQVWNATGRKDAAKQIKSDKRVQSEALEPVQLDPQLRIVTEPGGLIIFSAAHMHSTVPNTSGTTRFSIDFRTVHLGDMQREHGAHNIDSACTGTTIGDYLRGTDLTHVPDSVRQRYEGASPATTPLQSTAR